MAQVKTVVTAEPLSESRQSGGVTLHQQTQINCDRLTSFNREDYIDHKFTTTSSAEETCRQISKKDNGKKSLLKET